jgi:hypothetical protein
LSISGLFSDTTLNESKDLTLDRVDNIANFKIPLIDGAETVSTVLSNSKILFRKLPVILITYGRKEIYALEDLHWVKYECYSEISIQMYSRYPAGGL